MNFLKVTFSKEGERTIQKDEFNVWNHNLEEVAEQIWEQRIELQEKMTKLKYDFGIISQINLFLLSRKSKGVRVEYINVQITDFNGVVLVLSVQLQKEFGIKSQIDILKNYLRKPTLRIY